MVFARVGERGVSITRLIWECWDYRCTSLSCRISDAPATCDSK